MDNYNQIPKEKFDFAQPYSTESEQNTNHISHSYFADALRRFRKNKSSVAAAIIIVLLIVYAIAA
ncbi:MAG: hypothetical protein IJF48_05280, partial [Clostridia bacterium]|nr:hypothetical protein [Clostridia bacterium]